MCHALLTNKLACINENKYIYGLNNLNKIHSWSWQMEQKLLYRVIIA